MGRLAKRRNLLMLGAVAGAALVAAPMSVAASPVRIVITPGPFVFPAGFGCAFDVGVLPNSPTKITEFSDGRTVTQVTAEPTLTNLDTGTSYIQRRRFTGTDTIDPETNVDFSTTNGRFLVNFFPGDRGPFGVVGENGALLVFVGNVHPTADLNTGQITSFSYVGTVTDVCAILAA
jgi:hypothetical protein